MSVEMRMARDVLRRRAMRNLRFLLPAGLIVSSFVAIAAAGSGCSSSDASSPATSPDAASDAPRAVDPGPPDAAADDTSTPKDAAPSGPTITLAPAADQLADALCTFYQRCFPAYISEYTGSLAACKSGGSVALRGGYAPGALFDKAAFDASTACYAAISCDALYGAAFQVACAAPPPVNGAAVGAECNQATDCASNLCNGKTTSACGHCVTSTVVAVGAACDDATGKICPKGAYCISKCVAQVGLAATCDGDGSTVGSTGTMLCGSGLNCVSGKCAKAGTTGTTCTQQSDCDFVQLEKCDTVAGKCVPIQFLDVDAPCMPFGSTTECGKGLRCITASGAMSGTCRAASQPGQACVRSSDCVFGYNCRSNLCTAAGSDLPVCK